MDDEVRLGEVNGLNFKKGWHSMDKNVFAGRTADVQESIARAKELCEKVRSNVTPDLLGLALLDDNDVSAAISRIAPNVETIREQYQTLLASHDGKNATTDISSITKALLTQALDEVDVLTPLYLFRKIIDSDYAPKARAFFGNLSITPERLTHSAPKSDKTTSTNENESTPPTTTASTEQDVLEKYCTDFTALAHSGKLPTIVGRELEVDQVLVILNQLYTKSGILVGEHGVGKTAIAHRITQLLASENCPPAFEGVRLYSVDTNRLVAGTAYRGELEERVNALIQTVRASEGQIILFWNRMHRIGGDGNTNIAEMIKPAVLAGQIRALGATTFGEYHGLVAKDPDMKRCFPPIFVDEPTEAETVMVLQGIKQAFEQATGVEVADTVIEVAVRLSVRYMTDEFNPAKAIALIDRCCSRAQLRGEATVIVDDVMQVVQEWTGVPVSQLQQGELEKILELEKSILKQVIGQDQAVRLVADAVKRHRTGFSDPNRPASFLFLGPTGVGKTELAKCLAERLFGQRMAMVRLDMSEYMDKSAVSKMIGSSPGLVGYEEGGQLTEAIRKRPYSIVLFDEVEKAHQDVFNVLLQLLDDGRLTDGQGRTVSFKNTIVIMTSNLGSEYYDDEDIEEKVQASVKRFFKPEILNRIDEQVIFHRLSREHIGQIVELLLRMGVVARAAEKRITLSFSKDAIAHLADRGYDPMFGARPLRRTIMRLVANELAQRYLTGELREGHTVQVRISGGKLKFNLRR